MMTIGKTQCFNIKIPFRFFTLKEDYDILFSGPVCLYRHSIVTTGAILIILLPWKAVRKYYLPQYMTMNSDTPWHSCKIYLFPDSPFLSCKAPALCDTASEKHLAAIYISYTPISASKVPAMFSLPYPHSRFG